MIFSEACDANKHALSVRVHAGFDAQIIEILMFEQYSLLVYMIKRESSRGYLTDRLWFVCVSSPGEYDAGQRREEEALQTDLFRPADLRPGEDLRADQVPGRAGESAPRVFAGDEREPGQGECVCVCVCVCVSLSLSLRLSLSLSVSMQTDRLFYLRKALA